MDTEFFERHKARLLEFVETVGMGDRNTVDLVRASERVHSAFSDRDKNYIITVAAIMLSEHLSIAEAVAEVNPFEDDVAKETMEVPADIEVEQPKPKRGRKKKSR